jgi:CIC family chloride channel protein
MTGNFTLTLPIMLTCGIAALLAKRITRGSIYTTKLLRRGIDIERPKAISALRALAVADLMQPIATTNGGPHVLAADAAAGLAPEWERLVGPVTLTSQPQGLFAEEDLEQARRQLVLYGRDGLPVVSRDRHVRGWLTRADVLKALATNLSTDEHDIEHGAIAAEFAVNDPASAIHTPSTPLRGYELLELRIPPNSPARGHRVADIAWPPGTIPAAVTQRREIHAARPDHQLNPGERLIVLTPAATAKQPLSRDRRATSQHKKSERRRAQDEPPAGPSYFPHRYPTRRSRRSPRQRGVAAIGATCAHFAGKVGISLAFTPRRSLAPAWASRLRF